MTEREIEAIIEKRLIRAVVLKALEIIKHEDQPRDEKGRWVSDGGGGITTAEERQKKIDSINIDFERDNILPGLNAETLREFGFEDKPVLLKKSVIDKNIERHPDVHALLYRDVIGNALYNPDAVLKGRGIKPYFNFVHSFGGDDNAVVLLQVEDTNTGFMEIVNAILMRDESIETLRRQK